MTRDWNRTHLVVEIDKIGVFLNFSLNGPICQLGFWNTQQGKNIITINNLNFPAWFFWISISFFISPMVFKFHPVGVYIDNWKGAPWVSVEILYFNLCTYYQVLICISGVCLHFYEFQIFFYDHFPHAISMLRFLFRKVRFKRYIPVWHMHMN